METDTLSQEWMAGLAPLHAVLVRKIQTILIDKAAYFRGRFEKSPPSRPISCVPIVPDSLFLTDLYVL